MPKFCHTDAMPRIIIADHLPENQLMGAATICRLVRIALSTPLYEAKMKLKTTPIMATLIMVGIKYMTR